MTVFSPKGLLAGAALATASSFAFGISSAQAAPCAFGFLAVGTCDLATYSLTVSPAPDTLVFNPSGDSFATNSFSKTPATFGFTVTANSGFFFTQSSFDSSSELPGVTFTSISPEISLSPGGTTGFGDALTSISGTYTYSDTASTLSFVTDVPVPLPVVGAGMAFGFTRRLRKRAKSMA